MYEDLARSQEPSALERFVLTNVIPLVIVTLLLRAAVFSQFVDLDHRSDVPIPERLRLLVMPKPRSPFPIDDLASQRVVLRALVDKEGRVARQSITLLATSHPGLVDAAREALRGARFSPRMLRGRPVEVWVDVPIVFGEPDGTSPARKPA